MGEVRGKWTVEEDEFLINNYPQKAVKVLAEDLNRTYGATKLRVSKLGLKKSVNWTGSEIELLKKKYYLTPNKELSILLNKSMNAIENKAFNLGLKKKKYKVDETFFENIDTEEKAYWLGFLYADGCVRDFGNKVNITIGLGKKDELHLEKFRRSVGGDMPIAHYKDSLTGVYNPKITVNCSKLGRDLIKHGCIPNKTYHRIKIPSIDKRLAKHFIRGFFDGDGWVSIVNEGKRNERVVVGIVSYYSDILKDFQKVLTDNDIYSTINKKKSGNTYSLMVYRKDSIVKFLNLMYDGSTIYLDRKYEKSKLILNWSSYSQLSQKG